MKNFFKEQTFPLLIVLLSVIMAIFFYQILPQRFAIHWGPSGNPDGFANKSLWTVSYGPLTIIAIYLLFLVIPKIDPRKENIRKFKQYSFLRNILLVSFLFFEYLTLRTAASPQQKLSLFYVIFGLGLLFIFIGNYLPKIGSNFFVGIHTPWTLSSEEVWKRTHRIGGKVFILMGIVLIAGSFLPSYAMWSMFIPIIASILFMVIYSYCLYKKLEVKQTQE
jgi:uncharacterized membrane protein